MTALRFGVFVRTIIVAVLGSMSPAHAATSTVCTTVDGPTPNDCSRRGRSLT
jgi:Na+-transporting methylmalonyl-CoA/oxaloacetate decarboxylase beta subunit